MIFADDPEQWHEPSRRMLSALSARGEFAVRHVPPGEYLAVAVPDLDFELIEDEDYHRAIRGQATPLTIRDSERKTLNLELAQVD